MLTLRKNLVFLSLSLCTACGGAMRLPPGQAPTPQTVTKDDPGGNAHDPHKAALERQLTAKWGYRTDKDRQARFPLPDHTKWTRVRFMFVNHFTGFQYGDEHHTVSAAFVVPLEPGDEATSARCLQRFEENAFPKVRKLGGHVTDLETSEQGWKKQSLIVHEASGTIDVLFKHHDVALAWTAYPAYPGSCLAYAVAVPWDEHRELAEKVRDKWVEGFRHFHALTESVPYRHK